MYTNEKNLKIFCYPLSIFIVAVLDEITFSLYSTGREDRDNSSEAKEQEERDDYQESCFSVRTS